MVKNMAVTQKMIATEAGVGQSWVSWVLRGDPRAGELSSRTREKIKRIARERGYVTDAAASTMRSGVNSSTVAMLCETMSSESSFFIRTIININSRDFGVRIYGCDNLEKSFADIAANRIPYVISYAFSSAKLCKCAMLAEKYGLRLAFNMPFEIGGKFPTFSSDNKMMMHEMVRHLYSAGHRRIVLFCGPHGRSKGTEIRHMAFLEGLEVCGLEGDPQLICCEEYSDSVLIRFLLKTRPSALCTIYPGLAFRSMQCLASLDLVIPDDLSIITFGKDSGKYVSRPELSAMREDPPEERLDAIFDYFLDSKSEEGKKHSKFFPGSLEAGGSTAEPNPDSKLYERLLEIEKLVNLTDNVQVIPSYKKLIKGEMQ